MNIKFILVAIIAIVTLSSLIVLMLYKTNAQDEVEHQKPNGTMQLIVVPYFDPTNASWQTIYDQANKYPGTIKYVIVNPCSGPCGETLPQDWENVILTLKNKNVKTLGYIFNDSESFHNIDYYMKDAKVPTDRIFFDNEGSTDNLKSFKPYANYVHQLGGIVYINPGYNYSYVANFVKSKSTDVANIHEIYSSSFQHVVTNTAFSPWEINVIVGNVTNSQDMQSVLSDLGNKRIGVSYVYSDSYGDLPPFFPDEVQQASTTKVKIK